MVSGTAVSTPGGPSLAPQLSASLPRTPENTLNPHDSEIPNSEFSHSLTSICDPNINTRGALVVSQGHAGAVERLSCLTAHVPRSGGARWPSACFFLPQLDTASFSPATEC